MRPKNFSEFIGQGEVVGEGRLLRQLLEKRELSSLIFWGPPGVGKTTLARLITEETAAEFVALSAVESGKSELLRVIAAAKKSLTEGRRTVLFVDEIHRWNKAQQDALLPYVESGLLTLIGATTENPSFEIIGALLSRSRVIVLKPLSSVDIEAIIGRALRDQERGLGGQKIEMDSEAISLLAELATGDARVALNALELAVKAKNNSEHRLTKEAIKEALQRTHLVFDNKGEEFYNVISALHKSMRGSDANAALYWLARMLEGGADPLYVARRVVRFASEDVGMANSEALVQAVMAYKACHFLGMPECAVHLAQAVVYCAKAKKSNLLYVAYGRAAKDARETSRLSVPIHIRNAPTKLMKDLGYGDGVDQAYFPSELQGRDYFRK
ncbi:MAG: replication-associated recombination protein A [Candidatus Magasanikbacteria bacterium]|nr:replication-associated recombination protein A [Candidatus Magasanikbacteria bacterium]